MTLRLLICACASFLYVIPTKANPRDICATLLEMTRIEAVEQFRLQSQTKVAQLESDLDRAIDLGITHFMSAIKVRNTQDLIPRSDIADFKTLGVSIPESSDIDPPPEPSQELLPAYRLVAEAQGLPSRPSLIDRAHQLAQNDPYFAWLKRHPHNNLHMTFQPGMSEFLGKEIVSVSTPSDPVEIFQSTIVVTGPTMLSPVLSLIRVYRDLDPELPPGLRTLAQKILILAKLRATAIWDLGYNFSADCKEPSLAQKLVPDLKTGQSNLKTIYEEWERLYGPRFPRAAYDKFLSLVNSESELLQFQRIISSDLLKSDKNYEPSDLIPYTLEVSRLKKAIGVPGEFDIFSLLSLWSHHALMLTNEGYENTLGFLYVSHQDATTARELKIYLAAVEDLYNADPLSCLLRRSRDLYFWY